MSGTKATFIEQWCRARGLRSICMDYRGHGQSAGRFEALALSDWIDDARRVLMAVAPEEVVLVGSSMGGWIACALAREFASFAGRTTLVGLLGIASAPDFTDTLADNLDDEQRLALETTGMALRPSRYGDGPYPITRALLEDGATQRVLDRPLPLKCPVRLVHGSADADVAWHRSALLLSHMTAEDAELVIVKDADHRLSEPRSLERIGELLATLTGRAD